MREKSSYVIHPAVSKSFFCWVEVAPHMDNTDNGFCYVTIYNFMNVILHRHTHCLLTLSLGHTYTEALSNYVYLRKNCSVLVR